MKYFGIAGAAMAAAGLLISAFKSGVSYDTAVFIVGAVGWTLIGIHFYKDGSL